MFPLLLAQAQAATSGLNQYLVVGLVVFGLTSLAGLAVSLITLSRMVSGKANERQIEPTQLAALQSQLEKNNTATQALIEKNNTATQIELRSQTVTLNTINREVGEVSTKVNAVVVDVLGTHQRLGGISRELAATSARVDGLEKREGKK